MNIIIGRKNAEQLSERFTVLELEPIDHPDGMQYEAFCVVPAEKISLDEIATLGQWVSLHENLIKELRKGNKNFCSQAIEHLRGKFGGELDTFYDFIIDKIE